MRGRVVTVVAVLAATLTGCATPPVDVEGFPSFDELRATVARPVEPLVVPADQLEGLAQEPAALAYAWREGQRWTFERTLSATLRLSGAMSIDGRPPEQLGEERFRLEGLERVELSVEATTPRGGARLQLVHRSIRIARPGSGALDTDAGTTMGDAATDAWARCVGVPLPVEVDATGRVLSVDGSALRARYLEGRQPAKQHKALDKEVEKRLTDAPPARGVRVPRRDARGGRALRGDLLPARAARP